MDNKTEIAYFVDSNVVDQRLCLSIRPNQSLQIHLKTNSEGALRFETKSRVTKHQSIQRSNENNRYASIDSDDQPAFLLADARKRLLLLFISSPTVNCRSF